MGLNHNLNCQSPEIYYDQTGQCFEEVGDYNNLMGHFHRSYFLYCQVAIGFDTLVGLIGIPTWGTAGVDQVLESGCVAYQQLGG
jgi:hypothetical protein